MNCLLPCALSRAQDKAHARRHLYAALREDCTQALWLFIGHPDAGWRSAVIYSILISCRRRGINPQDYLTDVLARLPTITSKQIDQLLPENWPLTADSS